ncbi:hypothetical protein M9H77_16787 [Catharanthus roseus]|uniref:Uncharacterized protein n=1 Tax=Catharanthus roseus TaxID=4058 RepID=A0ACC0B2R0_CATRO|nr:hypothetical protein M9H77_16787 [Catharanthus roseus]
MSASLKTRVEDKGRSTEKELGTILEDLPISISLNPSLMWHEVSFVELELFLESYLSHEGLKFNMEGLEDVDKPPKLLMIHVIKKEQPIEKVGGTEIEDLLEIGPTIDGRPCTYLHNGTILEDARLKEDQQPTTDVKFLMGLGFDSRPCLE